MILVNNPGTWSHVYSPLLHAPWHGWTVTDLVFPFFLFIVGVSIVFAYRAYVPGETPTGPLVRKAGGRAIWLFALGVMMAAFPFWTLDPEFGLRDFSRLRIPGVLQRIALCYFAAVLLYLYIGRRGRQFWLWGLLAVYALALAFIPPPDTGIAQIDDPATTLPAYFDRLLIGSDHLWAGAQRMWDPEGLLSTIPAIASTLFGIWAGERLTDPDRSPEQKTFDLLLYGVVLVCIGYLVGLWQPVNKSLWTSSYAIFTAGQAMCGLALFYYVMDVKGHAKYGQPFVVYGTNAITVFVMSGLVAKFLGGIRWADGERMLSLQRFLYETVFMPIGSDKFSSLLYALTWITGWYLVLLYMYRQKWFVKV